MSAAAVFALYNANRMDAKIQDGKEHFIDHDTTMELRMRQFHYQRDFYITMFSSYLALIIGLLSRLFAKDAEENVVVVKPDTSKKVQ